MTRKELATILAYISVAINKPVSKEAAEVYFDLLGDLPVEVLQVAAKRVVLEHKWATFPSVAELREAAAETIQGEIKAISGAEGWNLAWAAAGRMDPEIPGSIRHQLDSVPAIVAQAMKSFGIHALCYGKEPVGVVRSQFLKIFDQIAAKEKRRVLLPPSVAKAIEQTGKNALPAPVNKAITGIGREAT